MQKKNAKILSLIFLLFNIIVLGVPLTKLEKKEEDVKFVTYKIHVFQNQLSKPLQITPEQLHILKQNVAQKVSVLQEENKNNGNDGNNDSDKNKRKALKSIADLAITEYVKIAASNHIYRKTNDEQAANLLAHEISDTTLHSLSQKNNLKYATEIETLEKLLKNNVSNIVWQQRKETAWAVTAWTGNALLSSLNFCASHASEILKLAQICLDILELSQQWKELQQRELQLQQQQSPALRANQHSTPIPQPAPNPARTFDTQSCAVCLEDFGDVVEGITIQRTYFACGHDICVSCKRITNRCHYRCN